MKETFPEVIFETLKRIIFQPKQTLVSTPWFLFDRGIMVLDWDVMRGLLRWSDLPVFFLATYAGTLMCQRMIPFVHGGLDYLWFFGGLVCTCMLVWKIKEWLDWTVIEWNRESMDKMLARLEAEEDE